jgi:hypothetical protein
MSDAEALALLRGLHTYVVEYGGDDLRMSELAADLAMSMDVTSDEADSLRREIEERLAG